MSGEPQLERSVLEGKERDKLQAIAEALGLKPTARAKKADLVDGILRATGVEVAPAADAEAAKPRRTTRKRVAVTAPTSDEQAAEGKLDLVDQVDQAEEQAAERAALREPDGPDPDDRGAGRGGDEPRRAGPVEAVGEAAAVGDPSAAGDGGPAAQSPAPPPRPAEDQAARNGGDPSGPATQSRPQPRPVAQPPGPPGPGNHLNPPNQNQQGGPTHPPPVGGQQQPGQQQPGPQQPGQPGAPGEGGEVRRNRRRRGRDRDRLGAGYDQQAQQGDQAYSGDPIPCDGLLELRPEGFGFLRTSGYVTGPDDVYVSMSQVRKFALRAGDRIVGASRPATTQERFGALLRIDTVGGQSPEEARHRPRFDDLTPVLPDQRLTLGGGDPSIPAAATARVVDLVAPIGKGQRATIVAPPRSGATTVLQHVAAAIEANHPDVDLMVVLVDERPEEVTVMRRTVKAEVIASTFDRQPEEHAHVAELAVEMAKRRAELGRDVVVLLDGATRLARAYNLAAPAGGRTLPSGLDTLALHPPKKLLAAARNLEEGGSLTILATVVDGGSPVDAGIADELQGVANMELRLDAGLAERRRYPAIDVRRSFTAHEELLLSDDELRRVTEVRRGLPGPSGDGPDPSVIEQLLS
jgi:transcription termination factor Rho